MTTIVCRMFKKEKRHKAKGLCASCYKKTRPPQKKTIKKCTSCERVHRIGGYGLCNACHSAWFRAGKPMPVENFHYVPKHVRPKPTHCSSCGNRKIRSKGLCELCYRAWLNTGKPMPVENFQYVPLSQRTSNRD